MTEQEKKVLDLTADVFNEFNKICDACSYNRADVTFHIHAIQSIIFSLSGRRLAEKKLIDEANKRYNETPPLHVVKRVQRFFRNKFNDAERQAILDAVHKRYQ